MGNIGGKRPQSTSAYRLADVFHHDRGTYRSEEVPPPVPTTMSKQQLLQNKDFTNIDHKALNVSPDLLMETFWDIVEHIIVKKSFEYIDEVLRVRAIFRWMTSFDTESIEIDMLPPEQSPIDYLMNIQQDFGDHCHLFYALCQIANIPCVIINGMTKNMLYVIGDEPDRELLESRWNAVFIKGQWRLIDPYWSYSCIDEGDYDDKISVDAKGKIKRADAGKPNRPVNEFYFLTDPKEFINTHFPDDPEWQLQENWWTLKQWQNSPYVREHFFVMGMKTNTQSDACMLMAKNSPISMDFTLPEGKSHQYRFSHNLVLIKSEHSSEGKSLRHFVMFEHSRNKLCYTVRVPFPGTYRLDIYGKDIVTDKLYNLLCSYGIKCLRTAEIKVDEYPDCPRLGWGSNAYMLQEGVTPIPCESIIETVRGEVEILVPTKSLHFINHQLKCKAMSDAELSRFTTGRFEKGKYIILVKVPFDGEFALKIFGKLKYEPEDSVLKNILTFLINGKTLKDKVQPLPAILGDHLGVQESSTDIDVTVPSVHERGIDTNKGHLNSNVGEQKKKENGQNDKGRANQVDGAIDTNTIAMVAAKFRNTEGVGVNGKYQKNVTGENQNNMSNEKTDKEFVSEDEIESGQIVANEGIAKLKFKTGSGVKLYQELCSTDDKSSKMMTCQKCIDGDGNWIFELDMPIAGLYSFNLIGKNPEHKIKPIYSCLVKSSGHPFPSMLKETSQSKHTPIKHETIVTQEPVITIPAITDIREISTSLRSSNVPPNQLSKVARVVKQENELAVHLKLPGEFTLDIFKTHSEEGLTTIARYYIVRKFNPAIDQNDWESMDVNALFDDDEENDSNNLYNRPVTEDSEVRVKATKGTLTKNIEKAISQKDLDKLITCMKVYDVTRPSTTDPLSLEANQMIMFLQAQKYLDKACQSRKESMLEDAVEQTKKSGLNQPLNSKIVVATRILSRIYKIDKISKIVSKIDQRSLAELKMYQTPPNVVHQTLVAASLLLGYGLEEVKDWRTCKSLLFKSGKDNLKKRMEQFDYRSVSNTILNAVKTILEPYKAWQVRDVSKGAATVFLWVKGIIGIMEYQQGNVERCMSGKSVISKRVAPRKAMLPEYSTETNGTIIFESEEWDDSDDGW
ncbi:uncharacterized protein LOC143050957 [Mytilus galloprovincialis]|uniref:uncharacterized protein LOC143050957 n=1 Tax=Mytilus galloprovincialis TaxID=29158 RepID=UPI003F7B706A